MHIAGAVDQNIERAEFPRDVCRQRLDVWLRAYVELEALLGLDVAELVGGDVGRNDGGAFGNEGFGNGAADTLPGMLEKKAGSILNIASTASSIRGVPNRYAYGATKAAVIGLTKAVAADFIKQGVRCNAICPGTIESPSLDDRIAALSKETGKSPDVVRQAFVDRQPMGRLGTAKEVALLALFLASDEASYITGQTHLVDGGMAL